MDDTFTADPVGKVAAAEHPPPPTPPPPPLPPPQHGLSNDGSESREIAFCRVCVSVGVFGVGDRCKEAAIDSSSVKFPPQCIEMRFLFLALNFIAGDDANIGELFGGPCCCC